MKPEGENETLHHTPDSRADEPARAREEEEEARRVDEKMRSLGHLAAGVAHDFNNSLAAILGRAQLLMRRTSDERQLRDLQIIETAALDAAEAVRRIQTFVRRAPEERPHTIAASRLVSDVIELTRTRWETDARVEGLRYEIEFTPAPEGSDEVSANSSEVREVLVNLVLNALDAMPGGGRLSFGVNGDDEFVRIAVRDAGRGILPDLRERIFEPFFTTREARGSGLGLAVSRDIVARLGGAIEVDSEVGSGTVFTIRLPRAGDPHPPRVKRSSDLPARRVLVVDDDVVVREVLVEMLVGLGQDVTAVNSAAEALVQLARGGFDVIITDLSMPSMDGLKLAAEARRLAPGIRIVLATGYGQDFPRSLRPDQSPVDAVVSKPYRFSDLEACLRAPRADET
ncbi:MAG: response regulator [Acidobacteria bacterium]|nr:response regulator [Acidobacteriota bacterium]